jgi:hypothetical protein
LCIYLARRDFRKVEEEGRRYVGKAAEKEEGGGRL